VTLLVQLVIVVTAGLAMTIFLLGDDSDGNVLVANAVVVAVGVAAAIGLRLVDRRPLGCTDAKVLSEQFRSRFFLRIGIAELAPLAGFFATVTVLSPWPYLAGVICVVPSALRIVPLARLVERDQEALHQAGCATPLAPALQEYPPRFGGWTGYR
jgi:hypothetical protein